MRTILGLILTVLLPAVPAHALKLTFFADLSSAEEVPALSIPSSGVGSAAILFDDASLELQWAILYSGLTGQASGAHFHSALPGVPGVVVVDVGAVSGLGNPNGSGLLTGSVVLSSVIAADKLAAEIAHLLAGEWYLNIHTEANRPGEIRGQVLNTTAQVPEPALALLLGAAGLALLSRIWIAQAAGRDPRRAARPARA